MQKIDLTEKHALSVTWLGLIANLLMAIAKGFVGIISHSSALIADAGHSFSDLLSDMRYGLCAWLESQKMKIILMDMVNLKQSVHSLWH